ncbi:restriction endonuclease subunit M [Sediminicola arcticus]|uniref:N-6 DNA methylase n=1 Tax=Sediminicola arcticus TaxID=1574308 RepID=A0ABV2SWD3_9FLAO
MNIIEQGIKEKLIKISEDEKQITYCNFHRPRNYSNPEEKVQAETFVKLVLQYDYRAERIKMYEMVTMGSERKEADIIVYNDDDCSQPHILVECKNDTVSEQEFLQAIEQAYSYAYALPNDVKYVWVTSGAKDEYFQVDKKRNTRITQPDIPQYGVKVLATYKYVYEAEALKEVEGKQKFFDLEIVEENVLTIRFKQAHDALWAGGQLNPSEAFDELDKLIFCKIWDERKHRLPGDPYDFQIITAQKEEVKNWEKLNNDELRRAIRDIENKRLLERVNQLYEEGRKKDAEVFRDNIRLSAEKIRTVVGYLQDINLGETDLDAKGRAFETFMDSFFRGNFGQYFTPRPIVKFAIDILPIKNDSFVLDTSCGSGGFLLYALNKIREEANRMYPNYKKDTKQYGRWKKYWHDFAEKNLFGIEINEQISRAAKMNMIIHDDGHTNVITEDGLLSSNDIAYKTTNKGFKYNHFDFIITNPPFGSSVRKSEKAYLSSYDFGKKVPDWLDVKGKTTISKRDKQNTEILFIEQCHRFLKEGGYLAIVLPDGILTNSSLQYVRDDIEDKFRIVSVVSIPQTAFSATGAGVKSSVLFVKKHSSEQTMHLRNLKASIQINLKEEFQYFEHLQKWEKEKKRKTIELENFYNPYPSFSMTELKKTAEYKAWKEELNAFYSEKVNDLKEQLQDAYLKERQTKLPDYPIFMAIAEDIGYDATGKSTADGDGDLDVIKVELSKFINHLEFNNL